LAHWRGFDMVIPPISSSSVGRCLSRRSVRDQPLQRFDPSFPGWPRLRRTASHEIDRSISQSESIPPPPRQRIEPGTDPRWRHGFEPRLDYQVNRMVGMLVSTLVKVETRVQILLGLPAKAQVRRPVESERSLNSRSRDSRAPTSTMRGSSSSRSRPYSRACSSKTEPCGVSGESQWPRYRTELSHQTIHPDAFVSTSTAARSPKGGVKERVDLASSWT
jgi:hypothetical protein